MAAGRTLKSLIGRRRRVGDEGEEDDGPIIVADSQSEGSVLSDADDDDARSVGEAGTEQAAGEGAEVKSEEAANGEKPAKKARKPRKKNRKAKEPTTTGSEQPQTNFKTMADTQAMMHGLQISEGAQEQDAVDFESMGQNGHSAPEPAAPAILNGSTETPAQRQRREHEEYRRKRDADPAFIPNRGNFFMHDTRGQQNGQAPQAMRGGPFSPANQMAQHERAAEQPWKHDLHNTINEEPTVPTGKPADGPQQDGRDDSARIFQKPAPAPSQAPPRVLNFSSTALVGKVQIRVLLPGMKQPIAFSEVPWKHYVRLPNHRPPLRRDKPVRVSIPDRPPHYIFPSPDRSFIFIPRQQRPSQQQGGYHRGSYQRSIGGFSRRTSMAGGSMYGGSHYQPSYAGSRRSSMAFSRADAFSPTGFNQPNRPVVRLPHGAQPFSAVTTPSGPLSGQHTPIGFPMQVHTYPLPQQPTFQGTPTSTVHQPRPQKVVSVTGIESPALLQQAPSNEPQPFQNQLPAHMHETPAAGYPQQMQQQPYYSPRQQYAAYPPQPQAGTPLSGIPQQAMHAPSFQPQQMPYQQSQFFPQYPPPQQQYYYSPPGTNGYAPMGGMYVPQQGYSMMPPLAGPGMQPQGYPSQQPPSQAPQHHQPQQTQQDPAGQAGESSGMVARESNGMVFYVPKSEVEVQEQAQGANYQPAESFVPSYAMPGLPPPTPAPDGGQGYHYPQAMPQMQPQMQMQGMWYPPQQQ